MIKTSATVDKQIVSTFEKSGTNFACSVPCGLLAGLLRELSTGNMITHVPVTREEEGVGVCAGAYLGGARPVMLMQNSGLGNSMNALLSLTSFYKLGLVLVIGFRGRKKEELIRAQIPMGKATARLLSILHAETQIIEKPDMIPVIGRLSRRAYEKGVVTAALLPPSLWQNEV